jgi:hypothetical protein
MFPRTRSHFVFLEPCGCPTSVVDASRYVRTPGNAWAELALGPAEEIVMRRRGVTVVHVEHDEYSADYLPKMYGAYTCPHGAA